MRLLLISAAALLGELCHGLRFGNVFQDHMVLQRDDTLTVWGYLNGSACDSVTVTINGVLAGVGGISDSGGLWTAPCNPQKATSTGDSVNIEAQCGDDKATLQDVMFGDVYLCSGQSNIDIPEGYANQFNRTAQLMEEAFADANGHMLRITIVPNQVRGLNYTATPAMELANVPDCSACPAWNEGQPYPHCQCNSMRWTRASAALIRGYSATCWFTGRTLYAGQLRKAVAVGMIRSSWGGTHIEDWMPSEGQVEDCAGGIPSTRHMYLYNGMINPFTVAPISLSGLVWYQAESNVGPPAPYQGAAYYQCALPKLLASWRQKFNNDNLPMFVVELAAYCNEHDSKTYLTWCDQNHSDISSVDYHLPEMRLAQRIALEDANTYFITAMDLGTLHPLDGSIHPAAKQPLGERIAAAASFGVYNNNQSLYKSPVAIAASLSGESIVVTFAVPAGAQGLTIDTTAACLPPILPVFCTGAGFEVEIGNTWTLAKHVALQTTNTISVTGFEGSPTRIRYAYADWPVVVVRNKVGQLPALIFDIPVN
eukprot:m.92287 g.92287  ORF g.92287 m.92287 type:complete len:539 (-) comp13344_c0_seq1:90-1706(-)